MLQSELKIENRVVIVDDNVEVALKDIPPEVNEVKIYDGCEFTISTPTPYKGMTTIYKSGMYDFNPQSISGDYLIFKYDIA